MTYNVFSGTLNPTHSHSSLGDSWASCLLLHETRFSIFVNAVSLKNRNRTVPNNCIVQEVELRFSVSRPTWHKIGHFGDVLSSQSLGLVLKVWYKRSDVLPPRRDGGLRSIECSLVIVGCDQVIVSPVYCRIMLLLLLIGILHLFTYLPVFNCVSNGNRISSRNSNV